MLRISWKGDVINAEDLEKIEIVKNNCNQKEQLNILVNDEERVTGESNTHRIYCTQEKQWEIESNVFNEFE